jgi:hypothetical protein
LSGPDFGFPDRVLSIFRQKRSDLGGDVIWITGRPRRAADAERRIPRHRDRDPARHATMKALEHYLEFIERRRRWLLLATLVTLHLVLVQNIASPIAGTLLVVHVGLFLLWQPIVKGERHLSGLELALVASVTAACAYWANAWLLSMWVVLLAGVVGGKVFLPEARGTRLFYLLALAYLVIALLVLLTPQIVPRPLVLPEAIDLLARAGMPVLFGIMILLPRDESDSPDRTELIDFVYSAFVVLLLAVLVLGTLAIMLLTDRGYVESVTYALMGISGVLFLLAWAWNPRAGFGGIGVLFSRYVLSVGLPFQEWLQALTELSETEPDPTSFLERACQSLLRFPGVVGGEWTFGDSSGSWGTAAERRYDFRHGDLSLALSVRGNLGPALVWHLHLVTQVMGEFHLAKVRERQVKQLSYLQAIHETGARLTHDVKNLLQSLNGLCFAANQEGPEATQRFQALLRRQLPVITQRLQQTLDKLTTPGTTNVQHTPAGQWWEGVLRRFQGTDVRLFAIGLREDVGIPLELFNGALENLVQNAMNKKAIDQKVGVSVTFDLTSGVLLTVCDTGARIAPTVARDLLRAPVASTTGLGVGLYQLAREAECLGYRLEVATNEPGQVCFSLARQKPPAD